MRILVVSQYPIDPAIHGGQKRSQAIVEFYRKRHLVRHVAIYWQNAYRSKESEDSDSLLITDQGLIDKLERHSERSDILLGQSMKSKQSQVRAKFELIIESFLPDLIHIEQPYLVSPIKAVLLSLGLKTVVIHGSQNVESVLKESIYRKKLSAGDLKYLLRKTGIVEDEAIRLADINIGVSRADVSRLLLRSKRMALWLVAGNGTAESGRLSEESGTSASDLMTVFIGSAHPPNYLGIETLLKDTSFMSREAPLLLIGSVADYFRNKYNGSDNFWKGKKAIGQVSESSLRDYLDKADIIILPITIGGGSNLKTAEAIYARKKIIGTSFAFRGYESYKSFPNIYIANTPSEFKEFILQASMARYEKYTQYQERRIDHLAWSYALRRLLIAELYARMLLFFRR